MSIASISYSSLRNAASEAKQVARRLDSYADTIDRRVYGKLNSYNGPWSSNLSTAKSRASSKMSSLRSLSTKYERYADDLTDLKEQCEATDKSVRSKVSSLTATFKENHGIKNNRVINAINYFFTSIGNDSVVGRWLGDVRDQFRAGLDYFKQAISDWFHWDGGKELLKGIAVFALELAIGVLTIAGVILTGGALLVVIAGVVAGSMMILNAVVNMANEGLAYQATRADDPAKGRRLSELDTLSATLRSETDSRALHRFAGGIDFVNTVAATITLVSGIGNLAKNGFKWATGNPANINNLKIKDVLTWENAKIFGNKLRNVTTGGFLEMKEAIKIGNWRYFGKTAMTFGTDFLNNLKGTYFDFTGAKTGVSSVKTLLTSTKNLINGQTGILGLAVPVIPIANLPGGGFIDVGDFKSIWDNGTKSFTGIKGWFSGGEPIKNSVLEKLSSASNINVTVPKVAVPQIN